MPTSTLTSKGQTTIPRAIWDHLRLQSGDRIEFVIGWEGEVVLRPATQDISRLRGLLKDKARHLDIQDLDAAIRAAVTERYKQSKP